MKTRGKPFQKGHSVNLGKHAPKGPMSEQHKKNLSDSWKNRPEWKGGSWDYWKKQTLLRDNYTCQVCGFYDKEITEVDHILPKSLYPELRVDINNLQAICPNCHRRKTNKEAKLYTHSRRN